MLFRYPTSHFKMSAAPLDPLITFNDIKTGVLVGLCSAIICGSVVAIISCCNF